MSAKNAEQVLQREFLVLRAKILEIAATLDRIDRAGTLPDNTAAMEKLRDAMETLLWTQGNRAEAVQLLFSREYDPAWPKEFGLAQR